MTDSTARRARRQGAQSREQSPLRLSPKEQDPDIREATFETSPTTFANVLSRVSVATGDRQNSHETSVFVPDPPRQVSLWIVAFAAAQDVVSPEAAKRILASLAEDAVDAARAGERIVVAGPEDDVCALRATRLIVTEAHADPLRPDGLIAGLIRAGSPFAA
jgi:hypothetical protein